MDYFFNHKMVVHVFSVGVCPSIPTKIVENEWSMQNISVFNRVALNKSLQMSMPNI